MPLSVEDLELLADLECAECGPMVDNGEPVFSEWEVDQAGVDKAIVDNVCPLCGEELSQTLAASLDMLKVVAERFPEMGGAISEKLDDAFGGDG